MALDLTKPMQTRDGKPARLIYDSLTDHRFGPLVFAIAMEFETDPKVVERIGIRDAEGRYYDRDADHWDIVNAPTPDNMVIVTVEGGIADVTQVPDGVVVKVMDYDIISSEGPHLKDEHGRPCMIDFYGPAGLYHVWPFA